jgi:hypothetical protein
MNLTNLSVDAFRKQLSTHIEEIIKEQGWSTNSPQHRGYAFQLWTARMFCNDNQGFDTEPEDAISYGSGDLKADIVLDDINHKNLLIAQCKYVGTSKSSKKYYIDESEVNDFFNRHRLFLNKKWVQQQGNLFVSEFLREYREKVRDGYSVDYYFVSTAKASDRVKEIAEECTKEYVKSGLAVKCNILDFSEIKSFFVRSYSKEASLPNEVVIPLRKEHFVEVADGQYTTLVTVIQGNKLRNLYNQYKESLFAWNIRGFLGRRTSINEGIKNTAELQPDDFFYFNNGVSAMCIEYEIDYEKLELKAENFQIINGAQTVGSLAWAEPNENIKVLFRLTKTTNVKTSELRNQIINCNNIQNSIKDSDFRSNDSLQVWLEDRFKVTPIYPPVFPYKINYIRKRGYKSKSKGAARTIKLEDLAKIRYAFFHEPTLVHESPSSLWARRTEGGVYEKSFGMFNEELQTWEYCELWTDEVFQETLIALAFYISISDMCKKAKIKDKASYGHLDRLRYHALALAGFYYREIKEPRSEAQKILENKEDFSTMWSLVWKTAIQVMGAIYMAHVKNGKQTTYAFLKSEERWQEIKDLFKQSIAMPQLE